MRYGGVPVSLVAGLIVLLSCETTVSGEISTLERLRVIADQDTGTVVGTVVLQEAIEGTPSCLQATPCVPVADATVQLGIWNGSDEAFRDSGVTFDRRVALGDPRFEVVAEVRTDAEGRYGFSGLPRKTTFVIRALASQATGAGVTYFPSRFWLYESARMDLRLVIRQAHVP